MSPFVTDIRPAILAAVDGIKKEVDIAVIGLSGGADSTLCACLSVSALGADNVFGISMPACSIDDATFNARSASVAHKLGINHITLDIQQAVSAVLSAWEEQVGPIGIHGISALNTGNTRARLRMINLYLTCMALGEAHPGKRVRVIGTGNLSEDYIGYDTKWGDGACDIFPISDFFKKEVYMALDCFTADGLIEETHIDRVPSAGLWPGHTDEGELGFTYDEMAPAILYCMRSGKGGCDDHTLRDPDFMKVVDFVRNRHKANSHKLRPPGIKTIPGRS
ncbi:MAG TPA: NAD(+) synthase [Geothrix sp.]|uniref:NAD(+) synthase n=1 Tax=Geothrix mesophila TaxID=2922723 RepID=UPI001FAC0AF3|nr:NAD(+) synthase [Geothrix sp. SG198]HJV38806.1 NAD(+) synthase [Geothrix sp.]